MKVLFPQSLTDELHAIMINTSGGITGGDNFSFRACAGAGSTLGLTTQAAERLYRSQPDEYATLRNRLEVEAGARINWLPQETILFEGCALSRQMHVELAQDASLLLVEPLIFGRAAMGETLHNVNFKDRVSLHRQGKPLFLDAMTLTGDLTQHLATKAVGQETASTGAMALILYVAADAETKLTALRALLPDSAGASLIGNDLLVARCLAPDSFELRKSLVPAIELLSNTAPPRSWMT
ncbi:urease accessory protein UreD [Lentibacter algarum]|nr:urease accessory protein UreD [Lentibacter algarum]MBU2980785.1 urease accessory protein UreD [Lentibacter algarum]